MTKGHREQLISCGNVKNEILGFDEWHSIKQEGLVPLPPDNLYVRPDSEEYRAYLHALTVASAKTQEKAEQLKASQETFAAYVAGTDTLHLAFRRDNDQYAFAHLDNGIVVAVNELVVPGRIIRPRPLPVVEGAPLEIVALPSEGILTAPCLSPERLFAEVRDHIGRYVDLTPLDLELATYYVIFTWTYSKVDTAIPPHHLRHREGQDQNDSGHRRPVFLYLDRQRRLILLRDGADAAEMEGNTEVRRSRLLRGQGLADDQVPQPRIRARSVLHPVGQNGSQAAGCIQPLLPQGDRHEGAFQRQRNRGTATEHIHARNQKTRYTHHSPPAVPHQDSAT